MQSHSERGRPNTIRCMLTVLRQTFCWWNIVALVGLVMSSIEPATSQAPATNEPPVAPIQILVFPQRDFVSASGYDAADQVIVNVIHPNNITFSTDPAQPVIPQADPRALPDAPFAGIVEIFRSRIRGLSRPIRLPASLRSTTPAAPAGQASLPISASATLFARSPTTPTARSVRSTRPVRPMSP